MQSGELRERYESVRADYRDLQTFAARSSGEHEDLVSEALDLIERMLDTVEEGVDRCEEFEAQLEREREAVAELDDLWNALETTADGDVDPDLRDKYTERKAEYRRSRETYEAIVARLEETLDDLEDDCVRLGRAVASAGVYDPTSPRGSGADPAVTAELEAIVREIASETPSDWHEG